MASITCGLLKTMSLTNHNSFPLQCYASVTSVQMGDQTLDIRKKGCFQRLDHSMFSCRTPASPYVSIICCDTDFCNQQLLPTYAPEPEQQHHG